MVRVAVVGAGGWGKNHLRIFKEMGALAAFAEPDESKRDHYQAKLGVPGYLDLETLINTEDLDAISICTPTSTHYQLAKKAIEHGVPTLVEKPLTYSSVEGGQLLQLSKKNKTLLTVGFIERFNPAINGIKEILVEKRLGDPLLLEFRRENRWAGVVTDVGVILDTSVHDIDTARWLFESEPKMVFARSGRVFTKYDDFATIILGFDSQRTAFLVSNWVTPRKVREIAVTCAKGSISGDYLTQEIRIDDGSTVTIPKRPWEEPLALELKSFLRSVNSGEPTVVSVKDGVNTTKIAEAAIASAQEGVPIYLQI
ncbi:MAG: Gfo/Idh/MocA family oxidoreductase [Nitrososphaerales archaeon]